MKKNILFILLLILYTNVSAQDNKKSDCYSPNIKKADAAYSRGDYLSAFNYYKKASKCPEANSIDNGKAARNGMQKCKPTIQIEGVRRGNGCPTDSVSWKGGKKTYSVYLKNGESWVIKTIKNDSSWIRIVSQNPDKGIFTIEWDCNDRTQSRKSANIEIEVIGGVEDKSDHFHLFQNGKDASSIANEKKMKVIDSLWSDKAYMDIKDVVFSNCFDGGFSENTINNQLYADQITMLGIWLKYDGIISKTIDSIFVKIYRNGQLLQGAAYHPGYSVMCRFDVKEGTSHLDPLTGWGAETGQMYTKGTYKCEIWFRNKKLFSKEFKLEKNHDLYVSGIDFIMTDANGREKGKYSRFFKTNDFFYLKPKILYKNSGKQLISKGFNIRLIDPNDNVVNNYSVLGEDGKQNLDSTLYKVVIPQINSGENQSAILNPITTKSFSTKPGKWKIQLYYGTENKIFESHFYIYNSDFYLTLNGTTDSVIELPVYSGCQSFKIQTSSERNTYNVSFVHQNIRNTSYNPIVVYTHTDSINKLDLLKVNGIQPEPGIRVEMMTDSSFVVRWLTAEKIERGKDSPRYDLIISNECGSAIIKLYTPADSVDAGIDRGEKIIPVSLNIKGISMDMIFVRGGDFVMGGTSETNCNTKSNIQHVNNFYMSEWAVTQELWLAVMGKEPRAGWNRKLGKGKDLAAYNVSYDEAKQFIAKLRSMNGGDFHLPTETEFEYVFRGGCMARCWGWNMNAGVHTYKQDKIYEWMDNGKLRLYTQPWESIEQSHSNLGTFHIVLKTD